MPTEDAYSSGHLVLSYFWTCKCSNVEHNGKQPSFNIVLTSKHDVEAMSDFNVETTSDFNVETSSDFNVETMSYFNIETTSFFNVETM